LAGGELGGRRAWREESLAGGELGGRRGESAEREEVHRTRSSPPKRGDMRDRRAMLRRPCTALSITLSITLSVAREGFKPFKADPHPMITRSAGKPQRLIASPARLLHRGVAHDDDKHSTTNTDDKHSTTNTSAQSLSDKQLTLL
jgi:hypothetical protein